MVPDLTHHDHVRVLAQDGTQAACKGHPGPLVELDLADFFDTVFHRIFQGDDIDVRGVDLLENAVQGGGFTASRGARGQDHAVGFADDGVDLVRVIALNAELVQIVARGAHVQKSKHQVFSVDGGQGRDPDVDFPVVHIDGEPSVQGNPGGGDVHVAENLDARGNGHEHPFGRSRDLVQSAVDAKPHLHIILFRADMDVAGFFPDGLGNDGVHQTDHRHLFGHAFQ